MSEFTLRGGGKTSRSKDLQDFAVCHPEDNMSLRGAESSATKRISVRHLCRIATRLSDSHKVQIAKLSERGRNPRQQSSLLSNVENFDDKTVSSVSKKFEQVSNNATLKTVEQTAGLPRSQGYLLPRNDMRKKAAFTLAEVLITLGIIGVVAAMTLPTLIQNYQKRVYVTQLKKSVSVLSNGFRLMMAHDGVTELKDTHAFSGMEADACDSRYGAANNILTNNCSSIREGLASVFSGIQFAPCDDIETKYLNGTIIPSNGVPFKKSTHTCIKFPDGSELLNYDFFKDSTTTNGRLFVDINGPKNPNTVGRDIFYFWYFNNGILVPYGSQQVGDILMSLSGNAELHAQQGITSMYWRTSTSSQKCDISGQGHMCAGRVLEEDAMNY